ncbi:hypothetical protein E2C01_055857 [Portunus trituberculatus]|uniref:Uncharacterized protein n=1 Tax=Portunus trituberculatus TaxID=210409 RepID=A0A5B7GNW2_PORTR|nr:hypothetical protein [Portunus trituberculatus]
MEVDGGQRTATGVENNASSYLIFLGRDAACDGHRTTSPFDVQSAVTPAAAAAAPTRHPTPHNTIPSSVTRIIKQVIP